MDAYLGIDIGGTKCAVSLASVTAEIIEKVVFATEESQGPAQAVQRLRAAADGLIQKHPVNLIAIGIACGSPLDPVRGIIQSPPNLPSWKDVEIVKIFKEHFKVPTFLDNDANAGALAEYAYGAGKGLRNIIFITFGTGCGSGLVLDGKIYRGTNSYAGEIGHLRLAEDGPLGYHKRGSFEGFCSGPGLTQMADSMRPDFNDTCLAKSPTAADIGAAAANRDRLALAVFERSGEYLGRGLAILLDVLNPERVIIGSIFVRCEKFIRPSMERVLKNEALSYTYEVCSIVPAGLGEAVGDYAAFAVAHCSLH